MGKIPTNFIPEFLEYGMVEPWDNSWLSIILIKPTLSLAKFQSQLVFTCVDTDQQT